MDTFRLVKPLESIYSPNYSVAFAFENAHDYRKTAGWMARNWHTSFYYSAAYVAFIFVGGIYMSTRTSPLKLKLPLTLWNIALALFSITGTIRTWPEMAHVLTRFGFHHSVCANTFHKEVSGERGRKKEFFELNFASSFHSGAHLQLLDLALHPLQGP